jgi:hypothetical protein
MQGRCARRSLSFARHSFELQKPSKAAGHSRREYPWHGNRARRSNRKCEILIDSKVEPGLKSTCRAIKIPGNDYQRIVLSKGVDSVASVDNDVCTGCGHQITLNMQKELKFSNLVSARHPGC